jgi:uncharacterized protein (TIGR03067 family)
MRIAITLLVVAAINLAADDPKKDDTAAFKGNWTAVSIKMAGQEVPAEDLKKFKCSFGDKTYTNSVGGEVIEEGGYTIDAMKTPKTIDFDIKKGSDEGKKQLGIYKVEGDTLTMVVGQAGATERPKSLKPEAGDQLIEVVLERVKG